MDKELPTAAALRERQWQCDKYRYGHKVVLEDALTTLAACEGELAEARELAWSGWWLVEAYRDGYAALESQLRAAQEQATFAKQDRESAVFSKDGWERALQENDRLSLALAAAQAHEERYRLALEHLYALTDTALDECDGAHEWTKSDPNCDGCTVGSPAQPGQPLCAFHEAAMILSTPGAPREPR